MNIIGPITRDIQTSKLDSEKTVVNFSVGVNEHYRNKIMAHDLNFNEKIG